MDALRLGAAFDAAAGAYDADGAHEAVARAVVEHLAPTPGGLVVDVGTGTGAAAFAALELLAPARVVAVDVSTVMLEAARARAAMGDPTGRIEWVHGAGVPLPVPDGSVDVVVCTSSLHFLGRAALQDWSRVLRVGGQAGFTLPAASSRPSATFRRLLPADPVALPTSSGSASRVLDGTGLRLVHAVDLRTGPEEQGRSVVGVVAVTMTS